MIMYLTDYTKSTIFLNGSTNTHQQMPVTKTIKFKKEKKFDDINKLKMIIR